MVDRLAFGRIYSRHYLVDQKSNLIDQIERCFISQPSDRYTDSSNSSIDRVFTGLKASFVLTLEKTMN